MRQHVTGVATLGTECPVVILLKLTLSLNLGSVCEICWDSKTVEHYMGGDGCCTPPLAFL